MVSVFKRALIVLPLNRLFFISAKAVLASASVTNVTNLNIIIL